jgi:hypothetical protein
VVRAVVPDQEIQKVGGKERILRRTGPGGGRQLVRNLDPGKTPKGTRIGEVLVGADLHCARLADHQPHQLRHLPLDGLRIGTAVAGLELGAPLALGRGHPTFATQLRIGEGHERLGQGPRGAMLLLDQPAVAAEASHLTQDRGGGHAELTGDLAVAGAGEHPPEERGEQLGTLQPVGRVEGL